MSRSLLCLALLLAACKEPEAPAITAPWKDDFQRVELGPDYKATGEGFKIVDGKLFVQGGHNHPLWLQKRIPRDAVIELDASSASPDGDIKVEAWGDGSSFDPDQGRYTSSGYDFIMGGWKNYRSIIARMDEHADATNPARMAPKVEPGRVYHWKIVRKGQKVDWFVDDMTTPFLTYDDPQPLAGPGHEFFAFDDWETPVSFDNLTIAPAQ